VTYRVAVRTWIAAVALAALVLGATASARPAVTAAIRLDDMPIRPEVARTPAQRSTGLMRRAEAPRDGMLFVFPTTTTGGFWMKNTLVPLTIVFFDTTGRQVRKLTMTPCIEDPCRIYDPRRAYRFALELPASDTRAAARIGPPAALERLLRNAR
jgi:uncharacterized membrane protein (UPF0127 family)